MSNGYSRIAALAGQTLLRNVGDPVDRNIAVGLGSWKEALHESRKEEYEDIRIEQANEIRGPLPKARMNQWNRIVCGYQSRLEPLIEPVVSLLPLSDDDQTEVFNTIAWDLLHACMEQEYDEFIRTRFYRNAAQWYLDGHYVCGWDYSEGFFKPIVY